MLIPGLVSVTFRKLTAEQIIALAADSGLKAIEWGSDVHLPADQPAEGTRLRRLTEAAGLAVASYGSYYRLGESDPHPFSSYLETAQAVGAPAIRVWAGRKGTAEADEAHWQTLIADAQRIATMAAEANIIVAFEFHSHSLTDSAESAKRLLSEANHPNLRIYWQTTLGMTREQNLAELETLVPWLHNVHCFHYAGEPVTQHSLAHGQANWSDYLARVAQLGGDRYVMLEFVKDGSESSLRADAKTLIDLTS